MVAVIVGTKAAAMEANTREAHARSVKGVYRQGPPFMCFRYSKTVGLLARRLGPVS